MVQTEAATDSEVWAQRKSPLFRLPQELRDQIYYHVFSTTELAFDGRPPCFRDVGRNLELLRACRRTRDEIADRWIGQVWFSFHDVQDLLRVMTAIPPGNLDKIRFARVLCPARSVPSVCLTCTLDAGLRLLPGIRLDKLVVHGLSYQEIMGRQWQRIHADCRILAKIIAGGGGWKELHYICSNSLTLCGIFTQVWYDWERLLRQRDEADSNDSMTIYRLDLKGDAVSKPVRAPPRTTDDLRKSEEAESGKQCTGPQQRRTSWLDRDEGVEYKVGQQVSSGLPESSFLLSPQERWKGVRIVVKRGLGAD